MSNVPRWVLRLRSVGGETQTIRLVGQTIVVGRDARYADLCIAAAELARRHCSLERRSDGAIVVRDLGTAGGIGLRGRRVDGVVLAPGDELELADWRLSVAAPPELGVAPGPVVARLVPHPASSGQAIDAVHVGLQREPDGQWTLRYELRGDISSLELPSADAGLDPLRLWEHTCFELFARQIGTTRYVEWNFSPSMQQCRFVFSRYRERRDSSPDPRATLMFERSPRLLTLQVTGPFRIAPSTAVGPCVITRERSGSQTFWALAHSAERPDFHAPETLRPLATLESAQRAP